MMRILTSAAVLALAACNPPPPDDVASGVGFGPYAPLETERLARDEALSGATSGEPVISTETVDGVGLTELASNAPEVTVNNPGISDTNDFEAVSGRETIEDNAERLAAQRQAYQVIQPKALPTRSGSGRPNIVEYALGTRHPVGEPIWKRTGSVSTKRFNENCGRYASADLAQEDFLARGGPRSDRRGLDPDGDGYACYWDPTPFRAAQTARN